MPPEIVRMMPTALAAPPSHYPPKVTLRHERITFTLKEATAASGLSEDTLRRREKEGRLRFVRVVGRTLVDADSLYALLGKSEVAA